MISITVLEGALHIDIKIGIHVALEKIKFNLTCATWVVLAITVFITRLIGNIFV